MSAQLSLLDRTQLVPEAVRNIIEYGPIVWASDDGKTLYTVNGAYLNRWRKTPKGWDCDECTAMPADLFRITVAAAMTLAETWHRDSAKPEEEPAPPKSSLRANAVVPTSRLTDRQRELLARFSVTDNAASFLDDGHIDDWAEVKRVFVTIGAKWKTGKPGKFVFPSDVDGAEKARVALETGEIVDPRKADFFPTPKALARELVRLAGVCSTQQVLEPSAGHGAIAEAARELGAIVTCAELLPDNADRLRRLGFVVHEGDFLSLTPAIGTFDICAMNPPFGRGLDVEHVTHALSFVRDGGALVSVMHPATRTRTDAKTTAFRARVEGLGCRWIENDRGVFSESGTDVATLTLVVERCGRAA